MTAKRKVGWWRWPETINPAYSPWFVVLWRCAWWPLLSISVALAVTATWLMYGPRSARDFWGNL